MTLLRLYPIVVPGIFIIMGFSFILFPDWWWRITERRHKMMGLSTTGKPSSWNTRYMILGVFFIVVAIGAFLYAEATSLFPLIKIK